MLKYLTKIAMDMFPSVLATIIGAYIVNHYINAKPAEAPVAAAVAPSNPKKADAGKSNGKPAETSADVASLPAPGVTARGISERAVMDRPAADRAETRPIEAKPADTKPTEAVNTPSEQPRRHVPTLREKVIAKMSPVPAPVPAPVVTAPSAAAPSIEGAAPAASEDRKDATDLARAAIERLRNTSEGAPRAQESRAQEPRTQETARTPEPPRVVDPARGVQPALRPLPPPVTVSSTPGSETYGAAIANPPYTSAIRTDDPNRPIPPADIPAPQSAPPLDLRADATTPARERPTVADDMLSAAKSMFNAVLPKSAVE
ncbi:MAG: hypothetical protein HY852_21525 [Bradyrhizobium sp.]|uniref:hypothetical protein n=1 Tax=Bradyrhizobium sp. TaxID=376 RepID=UPI0025C69F6B|nr:hypothetical protein [Bradyrhizobium sp.]MBI5264385.1 hypothetical protein [Bradyrhizobium sp.]